MHVFTDLNRQVYKIGLSKPANKMTFRSFLVNPLDPGRERSLQVPIRDPSADCRKAEDDVNARKLDSRPVRHVITNKVALINNKFTIGSSQLKNTTT